MKKLSFPTVKLGNFICEVKEKVKNSGISQDDFTVYGVTNTDGITVTNNKASDDLGNYTVLRENQFAYNPYRVNVGSIGLSLPGTFGAVSPAYVVFETNGQISNEFLLYYLKSSLGINLIKWYGDRGGVRSALRFSDLKKIDFPDITLEQQNKLLIKIKKLDELLCELYKNLSDDKIEILHQSILRQAVEGKLCEQDPNDEPASVLLEKIKAEKERLIAEKKIKKQKPLPPISEEKKPFVLPKGWEWCRLPEIGELSRGKSKHRPRNDATLYKDGKYPLVQTGDVARAGTFITTYTALYNDVGLAQSRMWEKGTLCITIAANIADTGILSFDACFPDSVVGFQPFVPELDVEFFRWYIDISKKNLEKYAPATAQKNISIDILSGLIVPLPPKNELKKITRKAKNILALCDSLSHELLQSKQYASQLMESVLQEAFSVQETAKSAQVIKFHPDQTTSETELLAAARGKIREETWGHLCKRALEIAGEES